MAPHPVVVRVVRNLAYSEGVELQRRLIREMAEDPALPGQVVFAEHRPVVTLGRSGDGSNLTADPARLAALGIEFHRSNRGGDVTYHGPGQWTVYPLLRLDRYGRDLHRYLRLLEECGINFLARHGLAGFRRDGLTGVWLPGGKIMAVGVAVSRWIAWHGLAMNINPDLSRFTSLMHPCGIRAESGGVESLQRALGRAILMEEALTGLRDALFEVLSLEETGMTDG